MPYLVSAFLTGLVTIAGSLLGQVLLGLGLSFVEYQGFSLLFDQVKVYADGLGTGFTADMLAWAGFLRIDMHVSIAISAITTKMLIGNITNGKLKKLASKPG